MDDTGVRLLQQILACDSGALSAEEISYRNTDFTEDEIRERLEELQREGYVTALCAESVQDGMPSTFWTVTPPGVEYLKDAGLYEDVEILASADDALERSERILEIEEYHGRPDVEYREDS